MSGLETTLMFERVMKAVKAEFGDDYTLKLTDKRVGDSTISFNMKVEKTVINGRKKEDIKKEIWDNNCERLGIPKEWYGKTVRIGKSEYVICGLVPERPKNCIELRNIKGKVYLSNKNDIDFSMKYSGKLS